jgi:HTH-type transcriptional regulator/antitoxin MqsA
MKCPACGAAELIQDTRNVAYAYKGEATEIARVEGDYCPECGEIVLNQVSGDQYSHLIGKFQRQVNFKKIKN